MSNLERAGLLAIGVGITLLLFQPIVHISLPRAGNTASDEPHMVPAAWLQIWKVRAAVALLLAGGGLVLAAIIPRHRETRPQTEGRRR